MKTSSRYGVASAVIGTLCAMVPLGVLATEPPADPPLQWTPIDPARLDEMRGGMVLPGGMSLSFGIERLVHVNGELVFNLSLQIDDIARISPAQAAQLARINEGLLVQVGQGTYLGSPAGAAALVVQNNLDGQQISALTRLDLGVNTLGTLMELNSAGALQDALVNAAIRP